MRIRLSTLGRVRCDLDGQTLTDLPGQRVRCALLIYLAVERQASRETIQNLFWSDRSDEKGRAALKQTIYELRRTLGDEWIVSVGDQVRVHDYASTDLHDFQRAIDEKNWEAALALYGGAFLQGFSLSAKPFEFWGDAQRAHASRLHRAARSSHIADLLAARRFDAALTVARRWVELEPLEDEAQHKLIELLAASGERAAALRQAENYVRVLHADGLEPLEETRQLLERLRSGHAVQRLDEPLSITQSIPVSSKARQKGRRGWTLMSSAAVLLIAGIASWLTLLRPAARDIRSVGVYPFENISKDPEKTQYRADGLTEELIFELSRIPALTVPGRTSSFKVKGMDIAEAGKRLGVAAMLESSIQIDGTKLKVTTRLIRVADRSQLWQESYEYELHDWFVLRDDIVRKIARSLAVRLNADDRARLASRPTESNEAHDLYLQGRKFFRDSREATELRRAIKFFEAAIKLDDNYALAHSGLADAYMQIQLQQSMPRAEACNIAKPAAQRALQLDSTSAEIRASWARVIWPCDADLLGAELELRRAIAINGNYAFAHSVLGQLLSSLLGRHAEGIKEAQIARALDPLAPGVLNEGAYAFLSARMYDSTIAWYRRVREIESTPEAGGYAVAQAFVGKQQFGAAVAVLDSLLQIEKERRRSLALLGYIHARQNRPDSARLMLHQLQEMASKQNAWDAIALVHLGLDETERAMDALEKAAVNRPTGLLILLGTGPLWDPVRCHPRFVELRAKVLPTLPPRVCPEPVLPH